MIATIIYKLMKANIFNIFSTFLLLGMLACESKPEQQQEKPQADTIDQSETSSEDARKTILFFGNSLTAGYGLELSEAYPALIERIIDSLDLPYQVVNAGLSGETTASGSSRIGWVLRSGVDVFVLELGANDGLRGISTEETYKNLGEIIDKVRAENEQVKILLAGMEIPPSMGERYTRLFREIYPKLAAEKDVALIPFLLDGVAGDPDLNLPDGIHPTAEGHQIVAKTVWEQLFPLL